MIGILLVGLNYFLILSHCLDISSRTEEYCHSEVFMPRCELNQIIVVEEAIYGRKKFGRCLQDEDEPSQANLNDPKFIECYSDVKDLAITKCFGKQHCELRIVEIKATTPCHKYLKLYLEIVYSCLNVAQSNRHCTISVSQERQYLFRSHDSTIGCGTKEQPWIVESLVGQRLLLGGNVFFTYKTKNSEGSQTGCKTYGFVTEKSQNSKSPICLKLNDQSTKIYESKYNQVEVYLNEEKLKDHQTASFLLYAEASGCSDLIPPADAWLKRTENEAIIGCYSTRLRWQLKCVGQRWIGVIGNCSYTHPNDYDTILNSDVKVEKKGQDQVVTVLAIVMFGFVFCLLIACVGIVFLKRHYAMSKSKVIKQMSFEPRMDGNTKLLTLKGNGFPNKEWQLNNADVSHLTNGSLQFQDSAQYFELDQSLTGKDHPA